MAWSSTTTSTSCGQNEMQNELRSAGTKVFPELQAGEEFSGEPTEIESLCMNCHEQGVTKLLLVSIPFFREVIVSSFECESCGFKDSEVKSAMMIQEKAAKIALQVAYKKDLNRQVVKSEAAVIKIPHIELEIPAGKGCFTTIEGLIRTTCDELEFDQPKRRLLDSETAGKIDAFIAKLKHMLDVHEPFQVILDDVTGNSFIENPNAPSSDPLLHTTHYKRSAEQDEQLGITAPEVEEPEAQAKLSETPALGEPNVPFVDIAEEVFSFNTNCTQCNAPCKTNMKVVDIPHFKQVVIMAISCDQCGYRDNEVKSASGIADKACKMTLKVQEEIDLSRDILKSDTAACQIPELDIYLAEGTLGGRFTTVEGLIKGISDQLKNTNFMFTGGDSAMEGRSDKMKDICTRLESLTSDDFTEFSLIIDDAAGNSYIQDIYTPAPDPRLTVEHYPRSEQQDEELGLLGMKTENYGESMEQASDEAASSPIQS